MPNLNLSFWQYFVLHQILWGFIHSIPDQRISHSTMEMKFFNVVTESVALPSRYLLRCAIQTLQY